MAHKRAIDGAHPLFVAARGGKYRDRFRRVSCLDEALTLLLLIPVAAL